MKQILFSTALLAEIVMTGTSYASSISQQMMALAPTARKEQRCNARALGTISREHKEMRPDELVAYAFGDTKITNDTVLAPAAAVRSGGKWFRLSYKCETSDDGLEVRSFSYTLGKVVPRDQWAAHELVE